MPLLQPVSLNDLINKHTRTNSRQNINCSALFKQVQPESVIHWRDAVAAREKNLNWLAQHAFDNQRQYGCTYTYQRLYDYLEDLIITKTWRGLHKELEALKVLRAAFPGLKLGIEEAYDGTYGVDIYVGVMEPQKAMVGGIQVKPTSYLNRLDDQRLNAGKNAKYMARFPKVQQVHYLYYDEHGQWTNMAETVEYLHGLA